MTDSQDARTVNHHDDEISLVDLAKILIKRWKIMVAIFLVVVLGALAYALMLPTPYQYTSIYNVAEEGAGDPLEEPSSLVAKADNLFLGPITRELIASEGLERLPFETKVDNPNDTLLVTISSQATPDNEALVTALHDNLLTRLKESQHQSVERRRRSLERQLESANEALDAARNSNSEGSAEVVASSMARISSIEADLEELTEGEVSQTAVQSLQQQGTSKKLVLALGIVLGGMLAVLSAFFAQFASLVCASLKEDR
ncbi:Wzz/FepE/Etk N-terminal domain-containing protein [Aidingimonas lacisalsi]|uniref:Wzz/FepE/Etk N-terminal domain-containing protein n=1 Tax=Aidingimonas lacisalsi TaxID=2604086 RepID=UPI0011D26E30|nr:Wzz/FepE/Etk N-terminal domain-containing protein [Aidingimonas lacisalsi]